MTVAVGVRRGGRVCMAVNGGTGMGDDEYYAHGNLVRHSHVALPGAVVTWSGASLVGTLLSWYVESAGRRVVAVRDESSLLRLFVGFWRFARERAHLVEDRPDERDEEGFACLPNTFMVATRDRLFTVSDNLSPAEFERYAAIGSGAAYALGAMDVLEAEAAGLDAEGMATRAVRAAQTFDPSSGGEVIVLPGASGASARGVGVRAATQRGASAGAIGKRTPRASAQRRASS